MFFMRTCVSLNDTYVTDATSCFVDSLSIKWQVYTYICMWTPFSSANCHDISFPDASSCLVPSIGLFFPYDRWRQSLDTYVTTYDIPTCMNSVWHIRLRESCKATYLWLECDIWVITLHNISAFTYHASVYNTKCMVSFTMIHTLPV